MDQDCEDLGFLQFCTPHLKSLKVIPWLPDYSDVLQKHLYLRLHSDGSDQVVTYAPDLQFLGRHLQQ